MEAGQLGAQNKAASEKQGKMPSIPRKKSKKTRPKPPAPDPAILPKRGIEDPEVILPYKKMTRQEAADAFEKIVKAKELEDAFATIGEELLKNKNIDEPRLVFRYMAKRLRAFKEKKFESKLAKYKPLIQKAQKGTDLKDVSPKNRNRRHKSKIKPPSDPQFRPSKPVGDNPAFVTQGERQPVTKTEQPGPNFEGLEDEGDEHPQDMDAENFVGSDERRAQGLGAERQPGPPPPGTPPPEDPEEGEEEE